MDPGVPQTSNRANSRTAGAGAKKTPAKSAAKSNGAGAARQGPVDPRTEDPSSPAGLPRTGKALWRRPGVLPPRAPKRRDSGIDAPTDFSLSMPLDSTAEDVRIAVQPAAPPPQPPTVEVASNGGTTALAPTELVPTPVAPAAPQTVRSPILYDQAATIDDVTQIGPVLESRPLRRPIQFRRAPKARVRRVTRVVRHVDTWSVFKVAMVFSVFFYAVSLVAGVLLWQVAYATGTIDNVEKFFEGFGWETFKFNGGQIYHNAWIAGLFVAVGLTGLAVLMATLFNLITDLVGGVRLSVLEEEVRTRDERGTEPAAPVHQVVDDGGPGDTADAPVQMELPDLATEPLSVESG